MASACASGPCCGVGEHSISVVFDADVLADGLSGDFLHGDALLGSALAQCFLFVVREAECHGHPAMVST